VDEARLLGANVWSDAYVQCALADVCSHLLEFITKEWVTLAPEVLGNLSGIVRSLPPGRSLFEHYGLSAAHSPPSLTADPPSLPLLLSEVLSTRTEVEHAETIFLDHRDAYNDADDEFRAASESTDAINFGGPSRPMTDDERTAAIAAVECLRAAGDAHIRALRAVLDSHAHYFEIFDLLVSSLRGGVFRSVLSYRRRKMEIHFEISGTTLEAILAAAFGPDPSLAE